MTGDPLGETGEHWKVLEIRRYTEKDEIFVDIKFNYAERKKKMLI
jgi:hypothetical protein